MQRMMTVLGGGGSGGSSTGQKRMIASNEKGGTSVTSQAREFSEYRELLCSHPSDAMSDNIIDSSNFKNPHPMVAPGSWL